MKTKLLALIPVLLCAFACTSTNTGTNDEPIAENPVIGKALRYCNPLPMEVGPKGNAGGDVTVLKGYDGKYYMACTGGGIWVSEDFVNWELKEVEVDRIPTAPDIAKFNGKYYLSGNDVGLYVADEPLGPYEYLGDWKNTPSVADGWNEAFDTHIYVDDDNTPYLFYAGRGISGVFAVKLDPNDMTKFVGPCVNLVAFNPEHKWERYGERNEYPGVAWIEGPWVFKHNGKYYLQYSASGTQWKTYAEGYYMADSILGPYTYASNNPLLRSTEGMVTGTAHGCMVEGPDGNIWQFYTTVLSSPPGGRRIGMDRVVVDENGELTCEVTDTPQWAPGVVKDPRNGDSGSLPVTINKINAMNTLSVFSSEKEGKYASYAIDDYSGTCWEPEDDDKEPYLMIDLSPATRFDVTEFFTIDGMRLMFGSSRKRVRMNPANGAAGNSGAFRRMMRREFTAPVYKYRLEVSNDGENFTTLLDLTDNTASRNTIYHELPPTNCRFVKITFTDWPKTSPFGVIDFTVFGKADGSIPAKVAIPEHLEY